ncbi:MAG: LuxR C-terminal-related transcriptional regulator [Actinomyces sp.]|nr:LuxR C-terminal-related transcriptional regulator [Actinomyces sp.]MCI1642080.1 LuxR C-terminal-related transcriptional regulator [Actinomyces sp.]MCI1661478.1 LuxR C-terminal-related transcriptional regulator [Actinomyces sp.]MCI1690858.1 LuxR C-terminal-related transcriptional regulator [Actinomyces sp.]MCI1788195.1 LuxR C-terminal-related transcriptional regulator [Actinomyces sp.]MCI1830074.1 LuxR C-terminal-related transcriptional regulator [Actinomyces sp.]
MDVDHTRELWRALGLSEDDVRVYQDLLGDPQAAPDARAQALGLTPGALDTALSRLEALGLAARRDGALLPARPSIGVTALAAERRAQLSRAEALIGELEQVFDARPPGTASSEVLTVVRGRARVMERVHELVESARASLDMIDTPPYVSGPNPDVHDSETDAAGRGLALRTIIDYSALDNPRHVRDMLRSVSEGQQVRLSSRARTKLVIADRRRALLPLAADPAFGEPAVAVVSHPELVGALQSLFDVLFDLASPLEPAGAAQPASRHGTPLTGDEEQLIQLLSSGMNDTGIARHLGISDRTFRRRVSALMNRFGVESRFQLGRSVERHMSSGE